MRPLGMLSTATRPDVRSSPGLSEDDPAPARRKMRNGVKNVFLRSDSTGQCKRSLHRSLQASLVLQFNLGLESNSAPVQHERVSAANASRDLCWKRSKSAHSGMAFSHALRLSRNFNTDVVYYFNYRPVYLQHTMDAFPQAFIAGCRI